MKMIRKLAGIAAAAVLALNIFGSAVGADALSPYTPFPIAWQQREDAGAETQRNAYIPEQDNWCDYPWNRGSETGNTVGEAGCSLFSIVNAVFYKTGQFISPTMLADYALEKGYRTAGVSGVLVEFFKGAVTDFGAEYGMTYAGDTRVAEDALAHIRAGGVSSSNIYGHWITIADYDAENDLYLILDSCQSCVRCKNIEWTDRENGIAWLASEELLANAKSGYYGINGRVSALYTFDYTFTAEVCDADGNGNIEISDASFVLDYYARQSAGMENVHLHPHPQQNEVCIAAADADGNGEINIDDATIILEQYAANMVKTEDDESNTDNTDSTDNTKNSDDSDNTGSTENTDGTDSTESTENQDTTDNSDNTDDTGSADNTESTEKADGSESVENIASDDASDTAEDITTEIIAVGAAE